MIRMRGSGISIHFNIQRARPVVNTERLIDGSFCLLVTLIPSY